MGIDYDGGMIVGCHATNIDSELYDIEKHDYSFEEWAYDNGLTAMREYFDCDLESKSVGFEVEDVLVADMGTQWLADIHAQAKKFKALTGEDAYLIGMQDII